MNFPHFPQGAGHIDALGQFKSTKFGHHPVPVAMKCKTRDPRSKSQCLPKHSEHSEHSGRSSSSRPTRPAGTPAGGQSLGQLDLQAASQLAEQQVAQPEPGAGRGSGHKHMPAWAVAVFATHSLS